MDLAVKQIERKSDMSQSNNTIQPIFKKQLRYGIAVAVFETARDGIITRSVNVQKSYKRNGEWTRHNLYLDHHHLPFMIEALTSTWDFMNETTASSAQSSQTHQVHDSQVLENA